MKPGVVFYNPKSNSSGKKILPMSLLALGAVCEGRYECRYVDGNAVQDPLNAIRQHVRQGCNIIAVTVMPGPQLTQAYPHSLALRVEFPEALVIWGGYFPTLHPAACLDSGAVDFVMRGHGDLAFLEFLNNLENNEDPGIVPGLVWRDRAGRLTENPLPAIPHPDALPAFPYHRIDMADYVRATFLGNRTLSHHSSYGCPFLCNFCAVVNMAEGKWLAQSPARVAEVADLYASRWGVDAIEFYDNNFFTHEARTIEIAKRIMPLGLAWWGEARIDTLLKYSERSWGTMKESGLKAVFMGAESGSGDSLRRMNKGGTLDPEKTLEIAGKMMHHGIIPEFSFMVGNPPDPDADAEASMKLIRRIKKVNPYSEIILYVYSPVPLPGQLYDTARMDGFSFPESLNEWVSLPWSQFSSRRHAQVPWIQEKLRRKIRNFERVLNAYYPTSTDPRLTGVRRTLLRAAGGWRYHARWYGVPLELRALQKLFHYQRPETAGF